MGILFFLFIYIFYSSQQTCITSNLKGFWKFGALQWKQQNIIKRKKWENFCKKMKGIKIETLSYTRNNYNSRRLTHDLKRNSGKRTQVTYQLLHSLKITGLWNFRVGKDLNNFPSDTWILWKVKVGPHK